MPSLSFRRHFSLADGHIASSDLQKAWKECLGKEISSKAISEFSKLTRIVRFKNKELRGAFFVR